MNFPYSGTMRFPRPTVASKEMEKVLLNFEAQDHTHIFSFYVIQHFNTSQKIAANAVTIFGRSATHSTTRFTLEYDTAAPH